MPGQEPTELDRKVMYWENKGKEVPTRDLILNEEQIEGIRRAGVINTGVLQFFLGTDAYVSEMTPQLVPLSKLNHNFVLGLGIPLHSRT